MADQVGRERTKWCSGCHDPVVLFTGQMGAATQAVLLLRLVGGPAGPDLHVLPLDRRDQGREAATAPT